MLCWVVNSRLQRRNSPRRYTSTFHYSRVSNSLAPLSSLLSVRSLCFQYFAASFPKTPGWGYPAQPQQSVDFSAELLDGCGEFQRAQQINHSLVALYKLLAQGRISPRQAAVLAYIGSLVLRSLKAVDYDLDRFDEESENISAESDDEPGEEPSTEPVAAEPVGPGKEPLPATAEEFAAKVLDRKPN